MRYQWIHSNKKHTYQGISYLNKVLLVTTLIPVFLVKK